MDAKAGSAWPIVARGDEVQRALAALEPDAAFRGVALVGDSGMGKSTLARALADSLAADGQTVRFVVGTETGREVPLGAFSRSVTVDAHEPAAMLAAAHRTLETEDKLVLVVDDAQLLDALSVTLLHELAAEGSARLIVTIRSGEPVLDAVTALLKERLLLTEHVDAFTREQTAELVRRVLDDTVGPGLIDRLHHRCGGSPLLLRGLLRAGRENGVLVHTEEGWELRGPLHVDRELVDLLEFRLRSLTPDELEAMEVLAVAELLDWEILRELCDPDAVSRLERRGLIQLLADGSAMVAQLNHPVFGEVAIRLAGVVRTRQVNGMLAQALQKHLRAAGGHMRLTDVRGQIRLAQFMVRSDLEPDLDLIIAAAAGAASMSNFGYAEELARFAFDRGGGLPAALVLAEALSWQGRGEDAEAVLADVDPGDADAMLTVRWGCLRASNLFWGRGDVESARQVLAGVKDRADSEARAALVKALEVAFAFFSGDLTTALQEGPALCAADVLPMATVWAAVPMALASANAGRFDDVRRFAEAGLRAAALTESGPIRFGMGVAEVMALMVVGDYPEADRVVERYGAMAAGVPEADAMVGVLSGLVRVARGDLASACAAFRDAAAVLPRGAPAPWPILVTAWSAQAEGARGDAAAAAVALQRCEHVYGPQSAAFLPELELARAWERASAGQTSDGRAHAVRAAQIARRSGMSAVEMRALHTAVRFGDRSYAARLAELATRLNTPLAQAVSVHARGLANHDGDQLDTAANRFAEIGALARAADAAAQAAAEHARDGRHGKELASSTRAQWLAGKGDVRTPAVTAAAQPLPITDREREIAMLAVSGLSNRQIADRLAVSTRTVEGHLYRIFAKLGIERRDQLIHLLGTAESEGT